MAELLNMSVQGYGNIERGDTDLSFSRLELISKELGVLPEQIVGFGEKNNFVNSHNNHILGNNANCQIYTDKDLTHALEKSQQEVTFLKEKISLLEATITDLRNTVAVLQREK
jgi:transcriptional regulator with XRE-family HTH domain